MFSFFFIVFHLIELFLGVSIDKVVYMYNLSYVAIIIECIYESMLIMLNVSLLLGTRYRDRPGLEALQVNNVYKFISFINNFFEGSKIEFVKNKFHTCNIFLR